MKAIFKYEIKTTDVQSVEMPLGAQILTLQEQYDNPVIWCLVDTEAEKALRKLRIVGTGHPIEDRFSGIYVGTYQIFSGSGVFHLFDCGYENQNKPMEQSLGQSEQLGDCNFCNDKAIKRDEDGFNFCAKCL